MPDIQKELIFPKDAIPKSDSPAWLAKLAIPESSEAELFREYLVDKLMGFIERRLLNPDEKSNIRFTSKIVWSQYLELEENVIDGNTRWKLVDPKIFFKVINEKPENFQVDCLNILPVAIMITMTEVLQERGYSQEKIFEMLKGMIIHGARTELKTGEGQLRPLWPDGRTDLADNTVHNGFARQKGGVWHISVGLGSNPYTGEVRFGNQGVRRGDTFHLANRSERNGAKFGNGDCQNGFILQDGNGALGGRGIQVFGHATEIGDRKTNLTEECFRLLINLEESGITLAEFSKDGYIELQILEIDYVELYARMVRELQKRESAPLSQT